MQTLRSEKTDGKRRVANTGLMLAVNVLLIAAMIFYFLFYSNNSSETLREENLRNIGNLNQSAANIATSYFETRREKIADIVLYIDARGLTLDEALEYISESTSSPGINGIQLVGADFTGAAAIKTDGGGFAEVDYSNSDFGRLKKILSEQGTSGEILSTPEFTDSYTALKSFALYTHVSISDGEGSRAPYTLMLLVKSADIIELINVDGGYEGMSTVLLDGDGEYILSNNDFKAMNFFDYLYGYNDLSLDERNAVEREVASEGEGELYYKDSRGRDCVFRYVRITDSDWFCVTAVPIASFHMSDHTSGILLMTALMFALLAVDVTWLTALNRRLRGSMQKEQQANAAKSEFLSRMSHDIRTPLNGIIGSTNLALDVNNPPETDGYLRAIDSSGKFLLGLVNDVLDMSKVESGKMTLSPEPYRMSELREYLDAVIAPLAREKGVDFAINVDDDNGTALMLDRLRFHQICFNLLSNAVKFTPAGGRVDFTAARTLRGESKAALGVTVADTGCGMSEEFQRSMFDSFTQENRKTDTSSGTGLGLAIVKNLVTLMGGAIECVSAPGAGTTFSVHLDCEVTEAAAEAEKPGTSEIADALRGRRVLLCEDNETNRFVAEKLLEKKEVVVETAINGKLGAEMFLNSEPGYYDAILMDIMMPVLDGFGATGEIRSSSHADAASIPIIAMTANAYTSDIEKCLAAGMNGHVAKPVVPELLFTTLGRALM